MSQEVRPETAGAYVYVGAELDLFALARNWKAYLRAQIRPFLGSDVLEVGAGLGTTAAMLCDGGQRRWLGLEPDIRLAERAREHGLPACCEIRLGTVAGLDAGERFDSVLYVDVLEHIEADREELEVVVRHLRPGGFLVVLAPAHPWLFTAFDRAVGHVRRYTKSSLLAVAPPKLEVVRCRYLDSAGLLASLGNKLLLSSAQPTRRQILFWDRGLVRLSRALDPLFAGSLGKSVLAVWRQPRP